MNGSAGIILGFTMIQDPLNGYFKVMFKCSFIKGLPEGGCNA